MAAADRPREGAAARRDPGRSLAAGEIDILIGTHALFLRGCRLPRPGPGGGGRTAPLRRASAHAAAEQGQAGGRAGDDGDADPAHAFDDALRRPRRVAAKGEAAWPQANRDQGHSGRFHGKADRPFTHPAERRRADLLGMSSDRELGQAPTSPLPKNDTRIFRSCSARRTSAFCMAACRTGRRMPPWNPLPRGT